MKDLAERQAGRSLQDHAVLSDRSLHSQPFDYEDVMDVTVPDFFQDREIGLPRVSRMPCSQMVDRA
jgi:hypothetical protein